MKKGRTLAPAFTVRSVVTSIFTILITGLLIQFSGVTDRWAIDSGAGILPPVAMVPFLMVFIVAIGLFVLTRVKVLTRPEMLCVLYATLIAAPIMSHGFWRGMLRTAAAVPASSRFEKMDALSPKLWPHGPNILKGVLSDPKGENITTRGNVSWREVEVTSGKPSQVAVLTNEQPDGVAALRVRLSTDRIARGAPYLLTVLARARSLGAQARYFCRMYVDGEEEFLEEAFTSRQQEQKSFIQPNGFVRVGNPVVTIPTSVERYVELEFGLDGAGTVELHDAQLMDVGAIEGAYTGHRLISSEEYGRLPPGGRAGVIVKPKNMFSLDGLRFYVIGHLPLADWAVPVMTWGLYMVLLLAGMFAIAVIMRRQWIQNERYPLPLAQVPAALLGRDEDSEGLASPVLKNPLMWVGLGITLAWGILRIAYAFNPAFPNVEVRLPLKPYFTNPGFGQMWNIAFTVVPLALGIGLFIELNVLMSIVVGFFLYRAQQWFGESSGLGVVSGYPFSNYQIVGTVLAYTAVILVFTRKYLWRVLKMAVKGERDEAEPMSYRSALLLFVACLVGVAIWAWWAELPLSGMLAFFLFLMAIGFVSLKLRAECGTPLIAKSGAGGGHFLTAMLVVLGGVTLFGAKGLLFASLAMGLFGYNMCLFNLPGLQMELLEVGRRTGSRPRHLAYISLLGVLGGLVIGGWVYLSSLYSIGADNYPIRSGHFSKGQELKTYNAAVVSATESMTKESGSGASEGGVSPKMWAAAFGGTVTAVLSVLRQLFAGFWFHPVGFIVGMTPLANSLWGSFLLAWVIRTLVLRLGGAATVREKLLPFATGVVLGAVCIYALAAIVNGYMFFFNNGGQRFIMGK